jgi:hypothetical protein
MTGGAPCGGTKVSNFLVSAAWTTLLPGSGNSIPKTVIQLLPMNWFLVGDSV